MEANLQVDETNEFSAPRFFDFLNKETEEKIPDQKAERWFETSEPEAVEVCLKSDSTFALPVLDVAAAPEKNATKCLGSIRAKNAISIDISQENQAIKRQKLEGGGSKKIHKVKAPVFLHKSKLPRFKAPPLNKKEVAPYISTAEMVQKFQSGIREIELPPNTSFSQDIFTSIPMRPKLTMTRPKEPKLETAQRVRARIKSSELEEDKLPNTPRFKARPLNKKILEASSLPILPRSTPQPPDFHEFHLKTMERANQHAETASVFSSADASSQSHCKPLKLTEQRPPILKTSLREQPTNIKSSQELELEEFEKIPKSKARPLNKKIFESKGDLGLLCQSKSQITTPQEFHFATNDRLGLPPSTMTIENFDKLSRHSDSSHHSPQGIPKITKPNPFHLHTEERGLEKEKLFKLQILQKELEEKDLEEEKARILPKMPPKPLPKQSTKPEAVEAGNHGAEQDSSANAGELQITVDIKLIYRNGSFGFASDAKLSGSNLVREEDKISTSEVCLNAFPVFDVAAAPGINNQDIGVEEKIHKSHCKPLKLTEPRPPILETSLRAQPTKIKSSQELELEELEKIPKFKARPLNKKIFESKGDLGLLCQSKSQITTPQEFHCATNDRLGLPPSTITIENFDKLSRHSVSSHHSQQGIPKITKPNPFHLNTEERGLEKEKLSTLKILQKELEEEKARIPPKMPPRPLPKQSTNPEAFHLDTLIKHEEEMHKMRKERERMEREEAKRRIFISQPIMKGDPIPLPKRKRKPLTDVQEFVLHVDHRAVKRSEFDQKMKEKELTSKRIREERENAKMIEEEKEIKQMRKTMVPHARPIPKFDNPFHPQKSTKEKTKPKSPKLLVRQRERKHALHLR